MQSFLYEKSYYSKEIHLAGEFKTPKLDQVIAKASEIEPEATKDFHQLNSGITTETFNKMIVYLNKVLQERQSLANKLQETEAEKKLTKSEFEQKERLVKDFPLILRDLERATLSLQEYLDVSITKE